ncbi:unnamed protein product, partial [Amoebophrya sp. A120]
PPALILRHDPDTRVASYGGGLLDLYGEPVSSSCTSYNYNSAARSSMPSKLESDHIHSR